LRACIARVFAVGLGDDSSLSLGPFDVLGIFYFFVWYHFQNKLIVSSTGSGIASLTSHQALEDGITQRSFALLLWALNNQGDFSQYVLPLFRISHSLCLLISLALSSLLSVSMARMLAPAPDYIDPSPFPLAWRAALFLVNLTAIRQMATVGSIAIDALLDPATSTVIVPASDVITMPFASPAMSRSVATSAAIRSVSVRCFVPFKTVCLTFYLIKCSVSSKSNARLQVSLIFGVLRCRLLCLSVSLAAIRRSLSAPLLALHAMPLTTFATRLPRDWLVGVSLSTVKR
jgi:hypothetical protein